MNRRSLLFVLLVTGSFFLIQLLFPPPKPPATPEKEFVGKEEELPAPAVPFNVEQVQGEEQFFLLQNGTQQLVFSSVGGALVEINLPFQSRDDTKSVVKEIGFDRDLEKSDPENARFPGHPALLPSGAKADGVVGGYYPLLRRSSTTTTVSPAYYALALVSEYPEMAELVYSVKNFTEREITFEATQTNRKITKTFSLPKEEVPYLFDLSIQIEGDSRGLWLTSGVPEVELMSGNSSPLIQYRQMRKGGGEVDKIKLPKTKEEVAITSSAVDWVVNSNGYFGIILDERGGARMGFRAVGIPGEVVPTRLSLIDPQYALYKPVDYPGYEVLLPFPKQSRELTLRVYAGPFEEGVLKQVDSYYARSEGESPDFLSCKTFYGWFSFISEPFAKLLFAVMQFFYHFTHSWVASIVLLTVVLRIVLYPLNAWSMKSMRKMQLLSPEIQAIQAKYKKEPKKAQLEIMELYRTRQVNPFTGCLLLLIQMPFLIAMFDLLKSSFQLRGASFIPGWIDNLTAPDVLFSWKRPLFFIGTQFHLLPILLGAVMYLQQRMGSTLPKDKALWTDQQRQQRTMGTIMTLVFTVMFYHFPSGLNIYWLSSMLLGIVQQWITNRQIPHAGVGKLPSSPGKGAR